MSKRDEDTLEMVVNPPPPMKKEVKMEEEINDENITDL